MYFNEDLYKKAKRLELESKWSQAAEVWKSIGRDEDANACQLIHEAISRGDAFRAEVDRVCGPEPQVENKEDSISWKNWYKKLEEVSKKFK